jgi:hypothetical protein
MKFSDLDNKLEEAPDLSKIKGKLQRAGTKLKKHTPFNKEARLKAAAKDETQQLGLKIKDKFHSWLGSTGKPQTVSSFKNFLSKAMPEYARFVDEVAVQLKFTKPEPDPEPEATGDEDLAVASPSSEDPDATGDKSKKVAAPEKEAELELEPEEEVEEEVDMSASIYESRLAYFLIEETKLKDNQLDTLIVRVLQKAKADGAEVAGDKESQSSDEVSKTADKVSKAKAPADDEELSVASPGYDKVSSDDIEAIKDRLDEFGDDVKDIIRKTIKDDSLAKEVSNKIDNLVYDMINDSF